MKKVYSLLTISILSLGIISPISNAVSANEITPTASQSSSENQFDLAKLDQYVSLNSNTLKYVVSDTAKSHLSADEFAFLTNKIAESNQLTAQISINKSNESLAVKDNVIHVEQNFATESAIPQARGFFKEGKNDIEFHWWGVRIWLSKTNVRNIGKGALYIAGFFIPESAVHKALKKLGTFASICPGGIIFDYNIWQNAYNVKFQ